MRELTEAKFWINGRCVLLNYFHIHEKALQEVLKSVIKWEDKRILVNDLEMRAIRAHVFLFNECCMGILTTEFSGRVNSETLLFDFPLYELQIYPGFQLYRLGKFRRSGNILVPEFIQSSFSEELERKISDILLGS